jgi:hypothetical protein
MNTIFDYFTSKALASYYNTLMADRNMQPFLGDVLFPARKKIGLDLKWIKGAKGLSTSLSLSQFDVKSTKKDRIGFSSVQTEMPFFKNDMLIDEKLRQELLIAIEAGNIEYIDTILTQIFDDTKTLLDAASVARERMRMQLISTGTITLAENGVEYSYDYGLEKNQKYTPKVKWSDTSADVLGDIIAMQDVIEDKGYARPSRAITSRTIIRHLMNNQVIKNAVFGFQNSQIALTEQNVKDYFRTNAGISIEVYDKKYLEGNVATRYIPEDLFILLPEGDLGNTWFGTTPEEADLMSGATEAEVVVVDTGVAITTTKTTDPVSIDTKVSQVVLPSFEAADQIVIADVIEVA